MSNYSRTRVLVVVLVCLFAGVAGFAQGRAGGPPPTTVLVPQGQTPPAGQTQAAPLPTTGTAAISGIVVDGITKQPVAGAVVSLSIGQRMTLSGPTAMATDNQGRYVFSRLPAGNYVVSASKLGYTTGRYGQKDPSNTTGRTIRLADGQWLSDANTSIWRPSAISGRVLDEAGEPVVGALVRVIAEVLVAGRTQLATATATKTDDRGVYRVSGLSAGKYVVMVPSVQASIPGDATFAGVGGAATAINQQSFASVDRSASLAVGNYPTPASTSGTSAYPITFHPSARTIPDATPIDLRWGEDRMGIDVRISPTRSVRVSGVIQGPADSIGGMVVRLLPVANEALGVGAETATGLSTGDGSFTLLNVPPGNYILLSSRSNMSFSLSSVTASNAPIPQSPGFRGSSSGAGTIGGDVRYSYSNAAGSREYAARMPLVVGDQNLNDVILTMNHTVTMTGRIVAAAPVPGAPGPQPGQPFPRIPVRLEPANGDPSLGMPTGTVTETQTFRIEGLMPGPYAFRTLGIGGAIKSIEWEGRDYADKPFDASTGRDIENVVVTLTNEAARINGTVRVPAGSAPGTGAVIIFPTDPARWTGYGFVPARITSVPVGTNGVFTGPPFPAGEYFLIAVDDAQSGGWRDPKFLEGAALLATRVTVGWGETKSVDLAIVAVKVGR